jgi:carboxymethylenebutenolidase
VVLTPNLYSRIGGKAPIGATDFERKRGIALAVPDEQVHGDLLAGQAYLAGRAEADLQRTGLIGFCMGGSKGLYSACQSAVWRCFVDFYGPVEQSADRYGEGRSLIPLVAHLACPIQFHVGDRDESCTPEQAEALRQELARHNKDAECYVYEGAQHAFHGDGPRHHPTAAALAWERALDYFRRRLAA